MKLKSLLGLTTLVIFSQSSFAANIATVNGKAITDDDLNHLVSNLPQSQRDAVLKDPTARKQLVQNLIDQEVLAQEATAKKIEDTKEFKQALQSFRKQELVNQLVQRQLSGRVTEAAAKTYYAKNKVNYSTDQVHAQHILLNSEKEAMEVLAEAKKPGADFQAVAEKRSKDPSVKNNRGDVGFFSREQFDPAFSNAAFKTNVGEVTGPIKTLFGYHIIKVVDRKAGKTPNFAEVEQKVRADIQREMLHEYITKLRSKSKISSN